MDEDNFPSPFGSNEAMNDISETSTGFPNMQKDCPLCKSLVRLYFINYHEQLLMCSNVNCDYPFGYAKIKFYTANDLRSIDGESFSKSTIPSNPTSTVSSSAWADIEQMNKVYEVDECQSDLKSMNEYSDKSLKQIKEIESQERLMKNMQNIKELNVALSQVNNHKGQCLSNEKYIKHLLNIQKMSGYKLLKQGELKRLKNKDVNVDSKLKIDIDSSKKDGATYKIKIATE